MNVFKKKFTLGLIVALVFLSWCVCFATPAHAKDYSLTRTDIVANVKDDASMDVTQARTFEFDGDFTLMLIPLGSNTDFTISSVTLNANGNDVILAEEPFQTEWRTSGGAGKMCYSVDKANGAVYVFTTSNASEQTVKLSYTYTQALQVHDDVAELYWMFVSDTWERASESVTCTVNLPVPAGESPISEDIRAWAHGQLNGHIDNTANGIVKMNIDKVRRGEYAETRIVFPTTWMNSSVKNTQAYVQGEALGSIINEEADYAANANSKRSKSILYAGLFIAIPVLFIILSIVLFLKFGKEYDPEFKDEYWRDVPDPTYHPAVIARNERWDKSSTSDLSATIMHLHVNGYITVQAAKREKKGIFRTKEVDDLLITEAQNCASPTDPVDVATMKFLFEEVPSTVETTASSARQLFVSDISSMAETKPETAKFSLDRWQAVLDTEVSKKNLFEETGATISTAYKAIAAFLVVVAVLGIFVGNDLLNLQDDVLVIFLIGIGVMFIVAILFAVFSKAMNRRTHHANEVHAKTKALKKWLCEFTTLNERPALDMKVWGEFMVYATVLGVADKAMKQMRIADPTLFENNTMNTVGTLPWWFWFGQGMQMGNIANGGNAFNALDHAFSNFGSALSSASTGDWSSGSGFGGGGFSIGGGGGFGGGGFGGAR